ncbi:Outer envelope protein 64, mitochondrial-like protein, partial [Drosera capensis]
DRHRVSPAAAEEDERRAAASRCEASIDGTHIRHQGHGEVTGFGNPDWERTHEEAEKTLSLLKNGATCVGVTVLEELPLGYEFKANHEEWVKAVKPMLGPDASYHAHAAIDTDHQNIKTLYKVRAEMRETLQALLKSCNPVKHLKFVRVLSEQDNIIADSSSLADTDGDLDTSELLKEKGNAAFKRKEWNKAVSYYSEAIKLNETNATYYSNRAAACLELGCFQKAEEDCSKTISLKKKISTMPLFSNHRIKLLVVLKKDCAS